jgi:hypothetical protein
MVSGIIFAAVGTTKNIPPLAPHEAERQHNVVPLPGGGTTVCAKIPLSLYIDSARVGNTARGVVTRTNAVVYNLTL